MLEKLIIIVLVALLTWVGDKYKNEALINVILKSILGSIAVFFLNLCLLKLHIDLNLQVGWLSFLSCGLFGGLGILAVIVVSILCLL